MSKHTYTPTDTCHTPNNTKWAYCTVALLKRAVHTNPLLEDECDHSPCIGQVANKEITSYF
jgi:hypothetical protein